jgi:hypothetical protein
MASRQPAFFSPAPTRGARAQRAELANDFLAQCADLRENPYVAALWAMEKHLRRTNSASAGRRTRYRGEA